MSDRLGIAIAELVDAIRAEVLATSAPAAPDRLLAVGEAASTLGIGRSVLYGEIQAGRLRSVTVGRRRLVPAAAIAEYIRARSGGTADDAAHRPPA
jgi:excisionase family DNA binding protein